MSADLVTLSIGPTTFAARELHPWESVQQMFSELDPVARVHCAIDAGSGSGLVRQATQRSTRSATRWVATPPSPPIPSQSQDQK